MVDAHSPSRVKCPRDGCSPGREEPERRPQRLPSLYSAPLRRWEYRVVSFRDGRYTEALNDYGREGWELVDVVADIRPVPEQGEPRDLPVPLGFGKLGQAAAALNKLEGGNDAAPETAPASSLLWVLRRPLPED